ncbi:uncharacterized protein F4807DRAFT_470797 [Annulohypoxylon truncatum]|uniref:uncharacterized protein n=1 Tax=Annulohypoxylon truncatum TaxID=327061 RepID=UPI0020081777|nr:uncharacterized protein F4807DRAFT_470797 [Annulohypoxylon truncatum]KAI1213470.1 hypothetical protein F4807DRAFT_470797 [Annulohypoxylon truncatum]
MEHDHVITIDMGKPEYSQASPNMTPSVSPPQSDDGRTQKPAYAASNKSCFVCRKTLLLSYFSCCAVCLGVVEYQLSQKRGRPARDTLPTSETSNASSSSPSSSTYSLPTTKYGPQHNTTTTTTTTAIIQDPSSHNPTPPPHCDSPYCRYTHHRPLMLLFAACELVPSAGGLAVLAAALSRRDFALLRFAGVLLLQWWQIFVLPRRWACGRSIVAGQLAACCFMVWFYVDAARSWRW